VRYSDHASKAVVSQHLPACLPACLPAALRRGRLRAWLACVHVCGRICVKALNYLPRHCHPPSAHICMLKPACFPVLFLRCWCLRPVPTLRPMRHATPAPYAPRHPCALCATPPLRPVRHATPAPYAPRHPCALPRTRRSSCSAPRCTRQKCKALPTRSPRTLCWQTSRARMQCQKLWTTQSLKWIQERCVTLVLMNAVVGTVAHLVIEMDPREVQYVDTHGLTMKLEDTRHGAMRT